MLLTLLFSFSAYATVEDSEVAAHGKKVVEKLIEDIQAGEGNAKTLYPTSWTKDIQSKEIDINETTGEKYPGGTAYGAICWRTLKYSFPEIKAYFEKKGVAESMVRKVKTLVNIKNLVSTPDKMGAEFLTEIDVPVVSNFETHVTAEQKKISDTKLAVEWRQKSLYGSLEYNQGIAILEPLVDQTKMTVIGIHLIKKEHKVPWVGRATASSFAKTHYCNFIRAVDALELGH